MAAALVARGLLAPGEGGATPARTACRGSRRLACEAVWPGEFDDGGFDRTPVVAGSGVRVRGEEVVFVPSSSTVDRLHSVERADGVLVSNSLPCLMRAIGARARLDYWRYLRDMNSVVLGLDRYLRTIPTTTEPVRLTYFHNLVWTGKGLAEREKPPQPGPIECFEDYRGLLRSALAEIAANMASGARHHRYEFVGTLSSGYDSPAIAALGAEAGLTRAVCFDQSRKLQPDDGEPVARALGLEPLRVERATWRRSAARFDRLPEVPFLAAMPTGEQAPFAAAREHLAGRVLLTGFKGDPGWGLRAKEPGPTMVRKDASGLGFAEYRLVAGFIHCPPAFWTARQAADVSAISRSDEMRPWVIGDRYQKPIARRIVEEAGVPRRVFGQRKQPGVGATLTKEETFLGPESLADYRAWLRPRAATLGRGRLAVTGALDALARVAAPASVLAGAGARLADSVARRPITHAARRRVESVETVLRPLDAGLAIRMFLFQWGLERAAERYPMPMGLDR